MNNKSLRYKIKDGFIIPPTPEENRAANIALWEDRFTPLTHDELNNELIYVGKGYFVAKKDMRKFIEQNPTWFDLK